MLGAHDQVFVLEVQVAAVRFCDFLFILHACDGVGWCFYYNTSRPAPFPISIFDYNNIIFAF